MGLSDGLVDGESVQIRRETKDKGLCKPLAILIMPPLFGQKSSDEHFRGNFIVHERRRSCGLGDWTYKDDRNEDVDEGGGRSVGDW